MRNRLPKALLELAEGLESGGIGCWLHGESLLDLLRPRRPAEPTPHPAASPPTIQTHTLLCSTTPAELLSALPRAVVTASDRRRLTVATPIGPVDLLPTGAADLESRLLDFGLAPLALAYRPADDRFVDPTGAREAFGAGRLDLATTTPNPFLRASRRYWICARMLAEYELEASPALLDAARAALPSSLETLPQGAPARRELARVLRAALPGPGLQFLREVGISDALFPGLKASGERMAGQLAPIPALRWAAWLRGTAIQSAMVRLRMPIPLARRIDRIHRAHPLDRSLESLRDAGIRKLLARLEDDEREGLLRWRRIELDAATDSEQSAQSTKRLAEVEARLAEVREHSERSGRVRALALDGQAVMDLLGSGPGPHVGRALAHLAGLVRDDPSANEKDRLEAELRDWAARNADSIR